MSEPSSGELSGMYVFSAVTGLLGIWVVGDRIAYGKFNNWLLIPFLICVTVVLLVWVHAMPNLSYNPLTGVPGIVADFGYIAGVVTFGVIAKVIKENWSQIYS